MEVKDALKLVIEPTRGRSRLSTAAIAARCGLAASTLYDYTNGRDLPARLIPVITHATSDFVLIESVCEACGGYFVPLPKGSCSETETLVAHIKEHSEFILAWSNALADGRVDEAELAAVDRELIEMIESACRLRSEMQKLGEKKKFVARMRSIAEAEARDRKRAVPEM